MVCFDIEIAYPLSKRENVNRAFAQHLENMRKQYRACVLEEIINGKHRQLRYSICDEDAVGFLRDLPIPTICIKIRILHKDIDLYSNFKATHVWIPPPKTSELKKVYWGACHLEKYQAKIYA
jgi:hypothetical protein